MENTKVCSTCKTEKSLSEFHLFKNSKDGHTHRCKSCVSRKKIIPNDVKRCNKCNIEKPLEYFNNRKKGKFGKSAICKECQNELSKNYREENIVRIRKIKNNWSSNRRKNDPLYKLECNIRCRLYDFLNGRDIQKNNTTFDIIGCTPKELKIYLENRFLDGMNWDNYGYYGWHVDHIIPLDSANTEDEIYKLCHYTNLQPLWQKDNFKKGYKVI